MTISSKVSPEPIASPWGASRALDYFSTDKSVDAKQVGIEGLSRYGKAALVTMAYDPRFAIGFIGSSGAGGAKILRRKFGEQVENLASPAEYHWFAGNFLKYAGPLTWDDLPGLRSLTKLPMLEGHLSSR